MFEYLLVIGNLGLTEILLIFLAILLLFGSTQIPKLARSIGSSIKEFKKARKEAEEGIEEEENEKEKSK